VNRVRPNAAKQFIGLLFESERPNVSQGFVLDNPIALDSVHHHGASIVNFSKGTISPVMGWGDHVHLMAIPN
jgi:hypothetical protein